MRFLLDTDHISILQRPYGAARAALSGKMALHPLGDFAFSIVSFHEQVLGAHTILARARMTFQITRGYALLWEILDGFLTAPVLPFDAAAGAEFDRLRAQRVRIGTMDLRIVAIALSRGLTLLTRNVSDFGKVPGLVTEDWTL